MNNLDKQYLELLQDILDNGVTKTDRTGTGTLSVFGRQIRHKMSEGFPLLTTKEVWFRGVQTELEWFLRGETNIQSLVRQGNYIWVGDAYKKYLSEVSWTENDSWVKEVDGFSIGTGEEAGKRKKIKKPLDKSEFIEKIKTDDEFTKKWGDMGPIYGKQWRGWETKEVPNYDELNKVNYRASIYEPPTIDQIQQAIDTLKTNPDSRRIMVNAWNVGELDDMVLPPCHYGFQLYTRELSLEERIKLGNAKKSWIDDVKQDEERGLEPNLEAYCNIHNIPKRALSLMWNQRSVDTPLGLPFNIASYGLLLTMIADEVNMIPDELIGNLGDTHIYLNQVDGVKKQLKRESRKLPRLVKEGTLYSIVSYNPHPKIEFPLSN